MTPNETHAILSPSGAPRWMHCAGAPAMEAGRPNTTSAAAEEGKAAHSLAEKVFTCGPRREVAFYAGEAMPNGVVVTEAMAAEVQKYVDFVLTLVGPGCSEWRVEARLPIDQLTGEEGASGTSDVVLFLGDELAIVDLKFGMGHRVDAENNEQLMIYALAAYHEYSLLHNIKSVRLIIHQPRLDHVSEWTCSVEQLLAFGKQVTAAANACWEELYTATQGPITNLTPGEVQCRWCKASGDCHAQDAMVKAALPVQRFEDLTKVPQVANTMPSELGVKLDKVAFVESWCEKVRAVGNARLRAGEEIHGEDGPYKLVRGRAGDREWLDGATVAEVMHSMRLPSEVRYERRLISPTTAEKLTKTGAISPRRWTKLQEYITRSEGGLKLAPATDKRPAVAPEVRAFADVREGVAEAE